MRIRNGRHGMTLIELALAISITGALFTSLLLLLGSTQKTYRSGVTAMSVDTAGNRTLEEITHRLRGADLSTLVVPAPPLSVSEVEYRTALGYDGGAFGLGDPMGIRLDLATGEVQFVELPGDPDEVVTLACSGVPAQLEGEDGGDLDDENGNGLEDEAGLCFTRQGNLLTVRLTLTGTGPDGEPYARTFESDLTCRN